MFKWVRLISFADLLTLANGLIGFLAIITLLTGHGDPNSFYIATILIFVAMLVDGVDGAVARIFGTKHSMGRHLDSISDSISFCIAPAVMLYVNFNDSSAGTWYSSTQNVMALLASMVILGFGLLRLARFTFQGFKYKNFSGIPTPAATFFVFAACMVFGRSPPFISFQPYIVLPLSILVGLFMILDVQYPKVRPHGRNFVIIAALVALMVVPVSVAWFVATPVYFFLISWIVLITFISIVAYLLFGPLYVKLRRIGDKKEMQVLPQAPRDV